MIALCSIDTTMKHILAAQRNEQKSKQFLFSRNREEKGGHK